MPNKRQEKTEVVNQSIVDNLARCLAREADKIRGWASIYVYHRSHIYTYTDLLTDQEHECRDFILKVRVEGCWINFHALGDTGPSDMYWSLEEAPSGLQSYFDSGRSSFVLDPVLTLSLAYKLCEEGLGWAQ
jgi:hypothetical protein